MEYEINKKIQLRINLQNQKPSQFESIECITKEYENIMEKFQQQIFQSKDIKKEKNEKRSEKLKNIPSFTNLLQKAYLDR